LLAVESLRSGAGDKANTPKNFTSAAWESKPSKETTRQPEEAKKKRPEADKEKRRSHEPLWLRRTMEMDGMEAKETKPRNNAADRGNPKPQDRDARLEIRHWKLMDADRNRHPDEEKEKEE